MKNRAFKALLKSKGYNREKLAEGIRAFAADTEKVEQLMLAQV